MDWEGAEFCYYYNGESYEVGLSDVQFAIVIKILGLRMSMDGITCFSDDTLEKFMSMDSNPLRLMDKQKQR